MLFWNCCDPSAPITTELTDDAGDDADDVSAAGLVQRENSLQDARVFLLSTTETGKETRQASRRLSDRLEVILTDPLSVQELQALNDILARLGKWVTSSEYRQALVDDESIQTAQQ